MQNVALRIYSGDIIGIEIIFRIVLQLFWFIAIYLIGNYLMKGYETCSDSRRLME